MNRPTKNQTKAIVYSCCWQSVSFGMRVGNGCILRRVGECGVSVGFEQRGMWGYGSHTSSGKILLPMYQVFIAAWAFEMQAVHR